MPFDTPQEAVTEIRERLLNAEAKLKAAVEALDKVHDACLKGWLKHGHMLVPPDEVEPLSGTPKPPKPPGP